MSNDATFFLPKLSSHVITVVLSLALSLLPVASVNAQDIITAAIDGIVTDSLTGKSVIEKRLPASTANTGTIKLDPEAKQARPSLARPAQEQNAASQTSSEQNQNDPSRLVIFPAGMMQRIRGVIFSREGDSFILRDPTRGYILVKIHDQTSIIEKKTNPYRRARTYPVTVLLRGLELEVSGRGDDSGALLAEKISISEAALVSARSATVNNELSESSKPPHNDLTPPKIVITSPKIQRGIGVKQSAGKITIMGQALDESGVREVTVGDVGVQLDDRGNFSAEMSLKVGDNSITVTATDNHGNRATESFTIRGESDPPFVTGRYFALVIGNNRYPNLPPERRLKTAINDAQEVAKLLEGDYGFKVKLLTDAKRSEVLKALNEYRKSLKPDDNLLIYYAGHGHFDDGTGKAYWMPTDAEIENNTNWIIADQVTSDVRAIPARHILIISDSCYSGAMTRAAAGRLSNPV